MSIILITGIPGAGKTLFAVSKLKKAIDDNMALPAEEQRKIYCDITGLNIEGIEPTPIDWRTTPPKSLLIYDEAQFHDEFKASSRGLSPYKQVEELTIHRKTGHEIWFITQDPGRLHKDILGMVEMHYHLERPYGAKLATIYQYRGAERSPKAPTVKERAERKSLFNYDKKLFDLYTSSQVEDGIKLRVPKSIVIWGIVLLCVIGGFFRLAFSEGTQKYVKQASGQASSSTPSTMISSAKSATSITSATSTTMATSAVSATALTAISSVASTTAPTSSPQMTDLMGKNEQLKRVTVSSVLNINHKCVAINSYGDYLNVSQKDCLAFLNHKKSMVFSGVDYMNSNTAKQVAGI